MNKTQKLILAYAEINDSLPNRRSKDALERMLGVRMENYLSEKSGSFDKEFRDFVFAKFDRISNYKRAHDKEARYLELKNFIETNGRIPNHRCNKGTKLPHESRLRSVLDNYASKTSPLFDQTFLNLVATVDPYYPRPGLSIEKRSTY